MPGVLKVRPIDAFLSSDADFLGKADPYVKVTVGKQEAKTSVCKGAGKSPHWKEELAFNVTNEDLIRLEIWDDDTIKDDFLGKLKIPMKDVIGKGIIEQNFTLKSRILGSEIGTIHLRIEYH